MVKVSYIEVTARGNNPIMGKPSMHLWEPTLATLENQTFKDFEYIVADIFYEERKDWFKDHSHGLRIKHIPVAPNEWHEQGLCQICHQINRGIIHADGDLLFFCADSNMHPPWLMEKLWQHYQEGWFVSLGFGSDVSYGPKFLQDTARVGAVPTEWYKFLDFYGHIHMDQRFNQLFEGADRQMAKIPAHWYYGISTVSLEAALKVNGFNLSFDPDVTLSDVDFGERLEMAGYDKLAMYRDCFVVEAYAGTDWHAKMKPRTEVKCTNGLLWYNKLRRQYRANEPISAMDIERIRQTVCKGVCEVKQKCVDVCLQRWPRGFWNRNEMALYEQWARYVASLNVDLSLERELRKEGSAYTEGTFVNC